MILMQLKECVMRLKGRPAWAVALTTLFLFGCAQYRAPGPWTPLEAFDTKADSGDSNEPVTIPRAQMPERVYTSLLGALESFQFDAKDQEHGLARNKEGLDLLRTVPMPDFAQLEFVGVRDTANPEERFVGWRRPGAGRKLVLVSIDFCDRDYPPARPWEAVRIDFGQYVDNLTKYLHERDPEKKRTWDFTALPWNPLGTPYHVGVFQIHHAIAAAWIGRDDAAQRLVHEALKDLRSSGVAFREAYEEAAWQSFNRGIELLESGADRSQVLAQWQETLRLYRASSYTGQVADLVGDLTEQAAEDTALRKSDVADPSQLPLPERVQYFIARLPDVHGEQPGQPARCITLGLTSAEMGTDTRNSDALVDIGWPALPALIDHLTDRRVTRSVAYHRNYVPTRTILRVQDVAMDCIEAILNRQMYNRQYVSGQLSTKEPADREKDIATVRAWWTENGPKGPAALALSQLAEATYLQKRLRALERVEAIDKKAVDSTALLKSWTQGAKPDDLVEIADALAERGDLSMLPSLRKKAWGEDGKVCERALWFVVAHTDPDEARALLLRWAKVADAEYLPSIAWALARRADFSLLPVVRKLFQQDVRRAPHGAVEFLLQCGDVEDYRSLRRAIREEIGADSKKWPSSVWMPALTALKKTKDVRGVPLLAEMLGQREMVGGRGPDAAGRCAYYTNADEALETLIEITGHDEGYDLYAREEKRFEAMDRWLKWWKKKGCGEFVKLHPDVAAVIRNK
jgi:hypothetical protein